MAANVRTVAAALRARSLGSQAIALEHAFRAFLASLRTKAELDAILAGLPPPAAPPDPDTVTPADLMAAQGGAPAADHVIWTHLARLEQLLEQAEITLSS